MLKPVFEELVALGRKLPLQEWKSKTKVVSPTSGGHTSLFKGRGLDFSEFREYSAGDDIRSIDWRVTARRGRPHTKIFIEERERSVYVIVDLNSYMEFGTRHTFKSVLAARAAALIAWQAHSLKDKTGAVLFGHSTARVSFLTAKASRRPIWDMFKILCASPAPRPIVRIEEALEIARQRITRGASVFIISDFFDLSGEFAKTLGNLSQKCDVTLVKVNDPADMCLPQVQHIRFSNDNGETSEVDTSDSNGAQRYRDLWAASEIKLTSMARKYRIKLRRIVTNGDLQTELFCPDAPQERRNKV